MSRLEPLQSSSLDVYPLSSSASRQALLVFSQLLSSCAGPFGKNHIIRNSCGGHMTITSACRRILSSMSVSRSELKLAVSAFTGHLQQCGDCGLFMAHMCLQLTRSALDLDIHHGVVSSVFQSFVSIIVDYIKSECSDVCVNADFSNARVLLAYIRSILTSKTLLNIPAEELDSLALIILNAFVKAIPSVPLQRYSRGVYVIGEEEQPMKNCKSVDGIIIEFPDFPVYSVPADFVVKTQTIIGELGQLESTVKVALITCSMSGDIEDISIGTFEATEKQFDDLQECVFEKIITLCDDLESENVGLVLCQKVIHPRVKTLLRSKSIIFVERLGSHIIPFIRDLTGCHPVISILQSAQGVGQCLGKLTSVIPIVENGKSYICLENSTTSVVTLVVCAEWEERLSELKLCVTTCLQGLESLVKEPRLLIGGGCWQMHCSHILQKKVLATLPEMCETLSCTESTIRQLLTVFRSCLHQWCLNLKNDQEQLLFDPASLHCWRVAKTIPESLSEEERKPCCCGLITMPYQNLQDLDVVLTRNETLLNAERLDMLKAHVQPSEGYKFAILDNLTACVEAFHKGVMTAGLLLSIGQFICDRN